MTRHNFFKDSFFPVVISEWNSLDINIRNSSSINVLKFIRPEPNSTYNINDTKGLKLITRLRLELSHLGDQTQLSRLCISNLFLRSGN